VTRQVAPPILGCLPHRIARRSERDKLDLKTFFTLDLPKSYLHATEDIRVPMPERSWHPRF
jgi:hypothetical protein